MKKLQTAFLVAVGLSLASGCSATGSRATWSRPFGLFAKSATVDGDALAGSEKQEVSEQFKAAQKILKKDPEGTILAYARLKEDNEEYTEARDRYREMLIEYPDNIDAKLGLSRIELATGRTQQAQEILQSLVDKHPRNLAVQRQLGQMYAQQENWPAVIEVLSQACQQHPDDQSAAFELGLAYATTHQLEQAHTRLSFAVGESAAMYNIGYVLNEQGYKGEAAKWFEEALSSHPDARTAHQAKQMLASLQQSGNRGAFDSQLAAGGQRQPPTGADRVNNLTGDIRQAYTQSNSTQPFTSQASSSSVLSPPAIQSRSASGAPLRTASWSNSGASSSNMPSVTTKTTSYPSPTGSNHVAAGMPAWGTQSASFEPSANGPSTIAPQSTGQQPPVWRKR